MNKGRRRRMTRRRNGSRGSKGSGVKVRQKKRMCDLLEAIMFLKTHYLRGASVIRGYHTRRDDALNGARSPAVWDDA